MAAQVVAEAAMMVLPRRGAQVKTKSAFEGQFCTTAGPKKREQQRPA